MLFGGFPGLAVRSCVSCSCHSERKKKKNALAQVHISNVLLAAGSYYCDVAVIWISSTVCCTQLANSLSLSPSRSAQGEFALLQNVAMNQCSSKTEAVTRYFAAVCHHIVAFAVRTSCWQSTTSLNKLPFSDQTAQQCW